MIIRCKHCKEPIYLDAHDGWHHCGSEEKIDCGPYAVGPRDKCWCGGNCGVVVTDSKDIEMATALHEAYERLAPEYGYETREDTKVFNPDSKNGRLMVAVCHELFGT